MTLAELISTTDKILLLDGSMGTQLAARGAPMGGQTNLSHPDAVSAVHRSYVECGVDLLITNTLTMNRVSIESHHIGIDVREVNLTGAELARKAASGGQLVLGDLGSTGKLLKPTGPLARDDAFVSYREQVALLLEGGVDGFIIETMLDLNECLCALEACRELSDLPVIASMSFETVKNGGRTLMGNTAKDCALKLAEAGASAVGTNCGSLEPVEIAEIIASMKEVTDLPLVAQPNAGKPRVRNGETYFDMTPADFAAGIQACIDAGAKLVGGCCGTSPDHIRAVAEMLGK